MPASVAGVDASTRRSPPRLIIKSQLHRDGNILQWVLILYLNKVFLIISGWPLGAGFLYWCGMAGQFDRWRWLHSMTQRQCTAQLVNIAMPFSWHCLASSAFDSKELARGTPPHAATTTASAYRLLPVVSRTLPRLKALPAKQVSTTPKIKFPR